MRLRKQLLFLSLVTLALPWVGCQYIRDLDSALKNGHSQALRASASAVSAHLANDAQLVALLQRQADSADALYAHPLSAPIVIDGYDEDWRGQGYDYQPLPDSENRTTSSQPGDKLIAGTSGKGLFLMLQIEQAEKHYFNPSYSALEHCDSLLLQLGDQEFALYASAPGPASASRLLEGQLSFQNEHSIRGVWLENQGGYLIELSLPLDWAREHIALHFRRAGEIRPQEEAFQQPFIPQISVQPTDSPQTDRHGTDSPLPQSTLRASPLDRKPLAMHIPELGAALAIFSGSGMKLQLLSPSGHILAKAGNLQGKRGSGQHGLIEWLYDQVADKAALPPLSTWFAGGFIPAEEIRQAQAGQTQTTWHESAGQSVARVAQPVFDAGQELVGIVVVEQSLNALEGLTHSAFNRLLGYSFLASSLAAVLLVLYATWLSLRIRRLSHAAANAISERGDIAAQFPVSHSADEIGELSRNYGQLLLRLREYTDYLRSLSGKLSHELRTPLAIVKSSLDNLEQEPLSKEAQTYTERAREGSNRLGQILNAMSAASRVEQALDSAERERIDCRELLANLQAAYADVYPHARFELLVPPQDRPLIVNAAGELLVQALDKLIDNAADFCPPGGRIELGLRRQSDRVVFSVYNEGPALPRQMQHQLFDSLVSLREPGSGDQAQHLGLGLYIVRLIAQFHQGEVQARNAEDGSGVIFEMSLPAMEG